MDCLYSCLYCCQQFHERYIKGNKPVQIAIGVVSGALLMVILLAICGAFRSTPCLQPKLSTYNVLSNSWAQTICKVHPNLKCKSFNDLPKEITIEGLWPRLEKKQTYLTYCHDRKNEFNPSNLDQNLRKQLETHWPTVFEGDGHNDDAHWTAAWEKHGACTDLKALEYFKKTVDLSMSLNITEMLDKKNIKPDNAKPVKKVDFQHAIVASNKLKSGQFVLRCAQNVTGDVNEHPWLKEVLVCVEDDVLTLKQCTSELVAEEVSCKEEFYFVENYEKWGPQPTESTTTENVPTSTGATGE